MSDIEGTRIADKRAWQGAELARSDWVTQLSGEDGAFYGDGTRITCDATAWLDFDLSAVMGSSAMNVLLTASADLATGKGFVLLRGLDANDIERLRRVFGSSATD